MQILKLRIDDHRCLVDFNIDFNINTNGGSSTILIGENGTGKSTMLQTILEILTSFDSDAVAKKINYQYEFEYYYKGSVIEIQHSEGHYAIQIDGELFCTGALNVVRKFLEQSGKSIFPERISYFYSGQNNLISYSIRRVESNYNQKCRKLLSKYWNALYLQNHSYEGQFPKRKYNNCTEKLVPVYLLAILCGQDSYEKKQLIEQCHFTEIENISVSLNLESFGKRLQNNILEIGNEGVCDLISFIDDRFTDLFRTGFVYQDYDKFLYDINNISKVEADSIAFFNFFEKLQNLLGAEIEVSVKTGNTSVISGYLSEGQRQLIKILGMLGVCKSEDALVLMDEPDVHMNPKWKYDIKYSMDESLKSAINTQAIIATHDPLVINGVSKEYIRIFTRNQTLSAENRSFYTEVITPTENTEGLGVDGLLQSEYYGLSSVLDNETKQKMDRRHDLLVKKKEGIITDNELQLLLQLTSDLENLTFARNIPTDSYYDEYVAAMHKIYKERPRVTLTAEDIAERNAKAEEILRGLLDK